MKDDLPRFPTPMEAFGQGKRKHTSAAFDAVGEIPKPPPQQRYRQKASGSPGPTTPVSAPQAGVPQTGPYYAAAGPPASAPATPSHAYHGMHHAMGLNGQAVPQPVFPSAHAYEQVRQPMMAPPRATPQQAGPQMAPPRPQPAAQHQVPYQPRVATAPPVQGGASASVHAAGPFGAGPGPRLPSNPMALQPQYSRPSPPPSREDAGQTSRRPAPAPAQARPSDTADLRSLFDEVDRKKNGYLTERELSKALVNGDYTLFDAHTVRLMMKMFDRDGDGAIYFAEFGQLWKYLHEWRQVFDRFDTSGNDTIDPDEFNRALSAFGYSLSASCVQFMFHAGSKLNRQGVREMPFDLFVQTCISIKSITDTFKRYDTDRDGFVTMSFEDFLTETTKLH